MFLEYCFTFSPLLHELTRSPSIGLHTAAAEDKPTVKHQTDLLRTWCCTHVQGDAFRVQGFGIQFVFHPPVKEVFWQISSKHVSFYLHWLLYSRMALKKLIKRIIFTLTHHVRTKPISSTLTSIHCVGLNIAEVPKRSKLPFQAWCWGLFWQAPHNCSSRMLWVDPTSWNRSIWAKSHLPLWASAWTAGISCEASFHLPKKHLVRVKQEPYKQTNT